MSPSVAPPQARILVVAGDRAATRRLSWILQESGYSDVVSTSSADRAVRLCHLTPPSLVVLDSCLGDTSSYDLAERLYDGLDPSQTFDVLMLADDGDEVPLIQARMLNATGVQLRPVAVQNLTREIRASLVTPRR